MKRLIYILILFFCVASCGGNKKTVANKQNKYLVEKYASILNTSKADIKNIKLYSFIETWYGTKYKYGGMSKSGIDCSGFCNLLYKQVYNKQISRTTSSLSKEINKVSKGNLKEGNLVFFNISNKKNSHVGIYLNNKMFVHASSSKGVIISSLENPYYKKAYNKGGKL
jgi:cell wall-associated NlpC family hydrolase